MTFFLSSNAFAISDQALIEACFEVGEDKIRTLALFTDCEVVSDVVATEVDNRFLNLSKYIWYTAEVSCEGSVTEVTKMVQYYRGKCY